MLGVVEMPSNTSEIPIKLLYSKKIINFINWRSYEMYIVLPITNHGLHSYNSIEFNTSTSI